MYWQVIWISKPTFHFVFALLGVWLQFPNSLTVQLRKACINIKYLSLCDSDLEFSFGIKPRIKLLVLISSIGSSSILPGSAKAPYLCAACLSAATVTAVDLCGLTPVSQGWDFDGARKVGVGCVQSSYYSYSLLHTLLQLQRAGPWMRAGQN
jgi:hypothetical protein